MAKRFDLHHPSTHPALREGLLCVCAASEALLGLPAEEGALFHTLTVPGSGRVMAHESAIRAWFSSAYGEYAQFMAEHLLTRPELAWSDILSLSVPFRPDRLCLTLALSPDQPSEAQGGPLQAQLQAQPKAQVYWNWSGSREGWDPIRPTACERRHHLAGKIPFLPDFEKGHKMALAELLLCTVVQANPDRLPAGQRPLITLLETAPLPVPAPPPEKRPNPVGRPRGSGGPKVPESESPTTRTAGDPRLLELLNRAERPTEVRKLPDGREIELIDWTDLQYPFGRRVQSKVAALLRVDHLKGHVYWEDEDVLQRYKQKGQSYPGQELRMMHFKTQFGRVTLSAKQLIWAYFTAEVPDKIRHITYIASSVPIGSLNGVYNMAAMGFKFGNKAEREAFLEAGLLSKTKIWRDLQGNEVLIVLRDRSYSKTLGPEFKVKPGTADYEIQKTRRLPALIGKIFAEKAKRGELSAEEAYRRAKFLCVNKKGWRDNNDVDRPLDSEVIAVREWLSKQDNERSRMIHALDAAEKSAAAAHALQSKKRGGISRDVNDYTRFAEWWVMPHDVYSSILQEEFRVVLELAPADYGVEPVDMEALADARGRIEK